VLNLKVIVTREDVVVAQNVVVVGRLRSEHIHCWEIYSTGTAVEKVTRDIGRIVHSARM
jgi:hypothetical protein